LGEEGWRSNFIVGLPKAEGAKMELVLVNNNCFWPLWLRCGPLYWVSVKAWDKEGNKCICYVLLQDPQGKSRGWQVIVPVLEDH